MSHYDAWKTVDVAGDEAAEHDAAIDAQRDDIITNGRHLELLAEDANLLDKLHDAFIEESYTMFHESFDAAITRLAEQELNHGD